MNRRKFIFRLFIEYEHTVGEFNYSHFQLRAVYIRAIEGYLVTMKLAFCLFNYFPYGGLQRDFLRIARECALRGHEVHVFTMRWQGPREALFSIEIIPVAGWQNHARGRAFAKALVPRLQANAYDAVIGFNKMPGLDLYYAADDCYLERIKRDRPLWYRCLPRYHYYVAAEKAVFSSESQTHILYLVPKAKAIFQAHYQTAETRFHLLPPGVNQESFPQEYAASFRQQIRLRHGLDDQHYLILMVASRFKTKGVDRALTAIAALTEELRARSKLMVIGDDYPAPYIRLAKQLKLDNQVEFLGGRDDVPAYLYAADLLLHPAYHENAGMVLLEAMVAGLPVLTVANCGYACYVNQAKAGIVLSNPFSQSNLNHSLAEMLAAPLCSWQQSALAFTQKTAMGDLAKVAVEQIERIAQQKKHHSLAQQLFNQLLYQRGKVYRQEHGRLTSRVKLDQEYYFIKQHYGVGLKEIVKNIFQGRLPVVSAKNEWRALQHLASIGIAAPDYVMYGEQGINPARLQSYVLMREITAAISLEELSSRWLEGAPSLVFKRRLIAELARIMNVMHLSGMNHRDCYLCHFLLDQRTQEDGALNIVVIDLHRAMLRRVTPKRWIIKDLAGLFFSSQHIGLTKHDYLRFIQRYRRKRLTEIFPQEKAFWEAVKQRGEQTS